MLIEERLRRLSEMNLSEIRFRIAQELRIKREQWRLSLNGKTSGEADWWCHWDTKKVSHGELRGAIEADDEERAASLLPEYFSNRKAPAFYWDLADRGQIVIAIEKHFGRLAEKYRADAEAICDHRFRIFAYPEKSFGPGIRWRSDVVNDVESDLRHYARFSLLDFTKVGDSKIVWEINRHQHFITLCQAYRWTGEERFAEECLAQWEDWLQQNPYMRGINWASTLEVAFRSWSWLWTFHLLLGSQALSGDRIGRMTRELRRSADFIANNLSTYFAPNTHLLGEGFALFALGLLLPELKNSSTWSERGRQILVEEMSKQVRNDGSHFEQSLFYHRYAVEFFLCASILADRNGSPFPATYRDRLQRMLEYLIYTAWPSGSHPSIGDSDGGHLIPFGVVNAQDHRPALSTGAVYFQRGDFRKAAGTLHEQTPWLLGSDAGTKFATLAPSAPSSPSRIFPDAGLVTMRSDWSENAKFLVFDAGAQGMRTGGHGHADSLSFVWAASGVEWLIDPGTCVYSASRSWRDFFRSTPAHNTIAVDGLDQAVPVDWFKWRKLPKVSLERVFSHAFLDYAVGSHNGYTRLEGPVSHRRHIIFAKPNFAIISDELTLQGNHKVSMFFHFAPGASVQPVGQGWVAAKRDQRFLLVPLAPGVQFRIVRGEETPVQGWYSADYGHREPASVLVGDIETDLSARFHWLLWPMENGSPQLNGFSGQHRLVCVKAGSKTDTFVLGPSVQESAKDRFSTDAALAFVRQNEAEAIERIVLLAGSSISSNGQSIFSANTLFDHFVAEWKAGGVEIDARPLRPFRLQSPPVRQIRVNGRVVRSSEVDGVLAFQGES